MHPLLNYQERLSVGFKRYWEAYESNQQLIRSLRFLELFYSGTIQYAEEQTKYTCGVYNSKPCDCPEGFKEEAKDHWRDRVLLSDVIVNLPVPSVISWLKNKCKWYQWRWAFCVMTKEMYQINLINLPAAKSDIFVIETPHFYLTDELILNELKRWVRLYCPGIPTSVEWQKISLNNLIPKGSKQ